MIPALCKLSRSLECCGVPPRALEGAGTRLHLGQTGNGETERPKDFPKSTAQDRANVGIGPGARKEEQEGSGNLQRWAQAGGR